MTETVEIGRILGVLGAGAFAHVNPSELRRYLRVLNALEGDL